MKKCLRSLIGKIPRDILEEYEDVLDAVVSQHAAPAFAFGLIIGLLVGLLAGRGF